MYVREQIIALLAISFLSLPAIASPLPTRGEHNLVHLANQGETHHNNVHNGHHESGHKTHTFGQIADNIGTASQAVNDGVNAATTLQQGVQQIKDSKNPPPAPVGARGLESRAHGSKTEKFGKAGENLSTGVNLVTDAVNAAENAHAQYEQWKSNHHH